MKKKRKLAKNRIPARLPLERLSEFSESLFLFWEVVFIFEMVKD